MDLSSDSIFNRKNLIPLLFLGILLLAIPIGVKLVEQTQVFRSRATGNEIQFSGTGVSCASTTCTTTTANVNISLTSPFGPPGQSNISGSTGDSTGGSGTSGTGGIGNSTGGVSTGGSSNSTDNTTTNTSTNSSTCPAGSQRPGQLKFVGPYGAYDPSSDPKAEKCKKFETNCEIPQGWQATDACATKVGISVSSSSGD